MSLDSPSSMSQSGARNSLSSTPRKQPAHFTFQNQSSFDHVSSQAMHSASSLAYPETGSSLPAPTPGAPSSAVYSIPELPPITSRSLAEMEQLHSIAVQRAAMEPTAPHEADFGYDNNQRNIPAVALPEHATGPTSSPPMSPQSLRLKLLEQQYYAMPRHTNAAAILSNLAATSLESPLASPVAPQSKVSDPVSRNNYTPAPANAQLSADQAKLRARRRTQRSAARDQRLAAAIDAWAQRRQSGSDRVQKSLQTAVRSSAVGASITASTAQRLISQSQSQATLHAIDPVSRDMLLDSDLEEDEGGGGEAFSFGLTARIKAARAQFWDSVTNISNHLTSLDVDDDRTAQRPKGGSRALMHSILDEPADRLRHLLRLHQDSLRAERELRIAEAAVLLDTNLHLKKLRRVEHLLALSAASRNVDKDDEIDDGIDEAEQPEVEFFRQAEAILQASDWHGHFRITHAAPLQ